MTTELIFIEDENEGDNDFEYHINEYGIELRKPLVLEPFQKKVLDWMIDKQINKKFDISGGILNLDPGLGKTFLSLLNIAWNKLQIKQLCKNIKLQISHVTEKYLMNISRINKIIKNYVLNGTYKNTPSLVCSSKSAMSSVWKREIIKFFGDKLKFLLLHKSEFKNKREYNELTWDVLKKYDIIVVTYDTITDLSREHNIYEKHLIRDNSGKILGIQQLQYDESIEKLLYTKQGPEIIFYIKFISIYVDESHTFANPKSFIFYALMSLYSNYKWCLSGTPIRNKISDLYSSFRFLGYKKCYIPRNFTDVEYEKNKLYEFVYHLTLEDSGIILPPVNYINKEIELKNEESEIYEFFLNSARKIHKRFLNGKETYMNVLTMCLRLRQICIAPYLVVPNNTSESLSQIIIEQLPIKLKKWIKNKSGTSGVKSTKIRCIIKILNKVPKTEKTIIFTMFTEVINLIISALPENTKYLIIDGTSSSIKRDKITEEFENNSEVKILFITYKSGGQSLNLAKSANNVILVEGWWCPFVEEQAKRRVIRIGQTKIVNVYKITIKGSIEERIVSICNEKLLLSDKILNGGKGTSIDSNMINQLLK